MPFATCTDGTRIYYRLEGDDSRPLLVMVHSLGADHSLWDSQLPALLQRFQVLCVWTCEDTEHPNAPSGDYTIAQLAGDVLRVLDLLGRTEAMYCGISIGGMVGQWIAANAPGRISRLVLANSSPRFDGSLFETRRRTVLEEGLPAVAEISIPRSFTARTIARSLPRVASFRNNLLATSPVGYAGCCAALRDGDTRGLLSKIKVPTLVIVGDHDVSTPWSGHGEVLAAEIAGAQVVRWPTAHLSNIEMPSTFTGRAIPFLVPTDTRDLLDVGMQTRRSVLGDAHVDRVMANLTPFTREFQEMITRYAWGNDLDAS